MSDPRRDKILPEKVLVTGGLGFIGSNLVRRLHQEGLMACAVDNLWFNGLDLTPNHQGEVERRKRFIERGAEDLRQPFDAIALGDVKDDAFISGLLARVRPSCVIHLAGMSLSNPTAGDPLFALESNVKPLAGLLAAMQRHPEPIRLIYISSSMVYGHFDLDSADENHPTRPIEFYGMSKLACEEMVRTAHRRFGLEATIVRLSAVYGPGDFLPRVINSFADNVLAGRPMTLYDGGEEKLDFTYVDDLVEGLLLTMRRRPGSETFNMTYGEARRIADLAEIFKAYAPNAEIRFSDKSSSKPSRGALDIAKARERLDFIPKIPLEEGIRRLLAFRSLSVPPEPIPRVSLPPTIRLSAPMIDAGDLAAASRVLRSGWLAYGEENQRFEEEFAGAIGSAEALSVNSCVSALILALKASGCKGEVLVPAYTYHATANAVALAGATPTFVDIEPDSLGMDPERARAAVNENTSAILAVHMGGAPCRIDELQELARDRGLLLIEDAAQALGARQHDRMIGGIGHVGCFSFFPTKTITTGEGGMLVSDDAGVIARARMLAAHGIAPTHGSRADSVRGIRRIGSIGYNFRMPSLLAAIGRAQLEKMETILARREALSILYDKALDGLPLRRQKVAEGARSAHHTYMIRTSEGRLRDELLDHLRMNRIQATVHYDLPVPAEAPYAASSGGFREGTFPIAEMVCGTILSLPLHPRLTEREVEQVARKCGEFFHAGSD